MEYSRHALNYPVLAFQYATNGAAGSNVTLTTGMNMNTNGYIAIGKGDTPAVKPLEVVWSGES